MILTYVKIVFIYISRRRFNSENIIMSDVTSQERHLVSYKSA